MKQNIQLWFRDYKILGVCNLSPHSLTQIHLEHFTTRKKASERAKKLFDNGLLIRFPGLCLYEKGRAEYIYMTSRKGINVLREWDIEGLYTANTRYVNRNRYKKHIKHFHYINQFRIIIEKTFHPDNVISSKFYYTKQIIGHGLDQCSLRPDAMFTLEHKKAKKKLLHFLEIDMGTESMKKKVPTSSSYSFFDKLMKYINYFDGEYYKTDFNELFKVDFKGFRLMVVTPSIARTQSTINLAGQEGADFLWSTEFQNLCVEHFKNSIWLTTQGKRTKLILTKT
jgi:hypothetical protein